MLPLCKEPFSSKDTGGSAFKAVILGNGQQYAGDQEFCLRGQALICLLSSLFAYIHRIKCSVLHIHRLAKIKEDKSSPQVYFFFFFSLIKAVRPLKLCLLLECISAILSVYLKASMIVSYLSFSELLYQRNGL